MSDYVIRMMASDIIQFGEAAIQRGKDKYDDARNEFFSTMLARRKKKFLGIFGSGDYYDEREVNELWLHGSDSWGVGAEYWAQAKYDRLVEKIEPIIQSSRAVPPDFEIDVPGKVHLILTAE